jgi:hypothetical protein
MQPMFKMSEEELLSVGRNVSTVTESIGVTQHHFNVVMLSIIDAECHK